VYVLVSVPYTEICYSPDSWFVIAQLIKCNKLSLRLHHHFTNRARNFVISIVYTGSLQQTKLCAFAMKASSCYTSQTCNNEIIIYGPTVMKCCRMYQSLWNFTLSHIMLEMVILSIHMQLDTMLQTGKYTV